MPRLTKQNLQTKGFRRKEIEIPGAAGTILIRELSAEESRSFRSQIQSLNGGDELSLTSSIVAAGVIEDTGEPMFSAEEIPGLPSFLGESTLAFIAQEIASFSGMLASADLEKKDAGN